jgi:hypothetical protein
MATRSTIALEFADGTVEQVYCHWDGYLSNNGQILQQYYTDPFKVRDLIDLGAISSLGKVIGRKHSFSPFEGDKEDYEAAQQEGCTTFYARDRGEELVKHRFKDYADYKANAQSEEYNYILRTDGKWYVEFYGEFDGLLEQAIMDEQDAKAQEETA